MMSGMRKAPPISTSSPRHHHFAPVRQRIEHQQHGGGIVVDHGGRLGPGQLAQQALDQIVAVAAPARVQVELQVGWRGQRAQHRGHGLVGQQRAAQVGVQHGAGQVVHGAQARRRGAASAASTRPATAAASSSARVRPPCSARWRSASRSWRSAATTWSAAVGVQRRPQRVGVQQPVERRNVGNGGGLGGASGRRDGAHSSSVPFHSRDCRWRGRSRPRRPARPASGWPGRRPPARRADPCPGRRSCDNCGSGRRSPP